MLHDSVFILFLFILTISNITYYDSFYFREIKTSVRKVKLTHENTVIMMSFKFRAARIQITLSFPLPNSGPLGICAYSQFKNQ